MLGVPFDTTFPNKTDKNPETNKYIATKLNISEASVRECEELKHEYHRKLMEAADDQFLKGRAAEWFVEKAIRINQFTKDENQRLLEQSIRNYK